MTWKTIFLFDMEDKFKHSEERRAVALAFIKANPGCVLNVLQRHLEGVYKDIDLKRAASIVLRMEMRHEVRRADGGIGRSNRPCSRFYALVDRTVSAAEVRAGLTGNLKGLGRVNNPIEAVGWHTPIVRIFGGLGP